MRQEPSSQPYIKVSPPLHLLEELNYYTRPGFFFHSCTPDALVALARRLYRAFGSQEGANMAMHSSREKATDFFAQFIDPAVDRMFGTPTEGSPGSNVDGDDGIGLGVSVMLDDPDGDTSVSPNPPARLSHEDSVIPGDEAMYNNILLLRDGLDYLEFRESIRDGDPGRTFEIVKVCSGKWLLFSSVN